MGMEKSIAAGREHRRPYTGAQAVDATCRCHGSCVCCRVGRMRRTIKRLQAAADREKLYKAEAI